MLELAVETVQLPFSIVHASGESSDLVVFFGFGLLSILDLPVIKHEPPTNERAH
jgi:hypothetical protein